MTGKRGRAAKFLDGKSYRDAAVANLPADFNKSPPPNLNLQKLIDSLRALLAQHPDGVTLNEARRSCPLLFDSELLNDHPSIRHLLLSIPEAVRLEGFGVQTRLFPAAKKC